MATKNPFDLLDDDTEDPSFLIAAVEQQKLEKPKKASAPVPAQPGKAAKLPTKPPPPAQAVRVARNDTGRGGGRGTGRGRGGSGFNRDSNSSDNTNGYSGAYRPSEDGEGGRQAERHGYGGTRGSFRGGRGGGFNSGESGEGERRPRRQFDRQSGTGHGHEYKRDGSGRGNWGSPDEVAPETEENVPDNEKNVSTEKQPGEEDAADASKENSANEAEKEPENKEMTLEEYEKILEEKRKVLLALKTDEGRKVDVKEFESMQQLSNKKSNDEIFIKLGSEKDKRKDADKEEKIKKAVSINEFLKPAEGLRYNGPGRGGRGRGRGGARGGGYGGNTDSNVPSPKIEDPGHFPSLGGK